MAKSKKKTIPQSFWLSGVVNFDFDESLESKKNHSAKRFLRAIMDGWPCSESCWCILHDQDIFSHDVPKLDENKQPLKDKGGNPILEHRQGDRKIEHIHFIIHTHKKRTKEGAIQNIADCLTQSGYGAGGKEFKKELITCSFCYSYLYAIRYLIHEDDNATSADGTIMDGEKMPYDRKLIATNDEDTLNLCLAGIQDGDITITQLYKAIDDCDGTYFDLIKRIGLNNANRYHFLIDKLLGEQISLRNKMFRNIAENKVDENTAKKS